MRWEFVAACAFRRVPWRDGALDCWDVGRGVFRFGNELFGAAYHLHEVSNRVKVGFSWQWWVVNLLSYFVIFFETLVE